MAHTPERLRLAMSVTKPSGRVFRWGGDEPDAGDVPRNLTFGTSLPGGFEIATCELARDIHREYFDIERFDDVRIYGPGNRTAYEGRMAETPRSHGDDNTISPAIIGHSSHLRDDESWSGIYIDRDMGAWQSPTVARHLTLVTANYKTWAAQVESDPSGAPTFTLYLELNGGSVKQLCEMWYDAGPGATIGRVYAAYTSQNALGGDANWFLAAYSSSGHNSGFEQNTGDLAGSTSGTIDLQPTARRYALLQFSYEAAIDSPAERRVPLTNLAAIGGHGLTLRGTLPGGLYGSDVLAHILDTGAPLLNYTTGTDGSIESSTLAIPHLVFKDKTFPEEAVKQVDTFHHRDWGVYDDKQFFWRTRGTYGRVWRARVGDIKLDEEGPQVETAVNGIVIQFRDGSGRTRYVGPPGGGFDVEDALLEDTSSGNPVNAHGIPRRWRKFDVGITSDEGAVAVGEIILNQLASKSVRGQARLTGLVRDDKNVAYPVWLMRAGDRLIIEDAADTSERHIIKTSYSHENFEITCDLDNPPNRLDALLARMQVVLVPLGL